MRGMMLLALIFGLLLPGEILAMNFTPSVADMVLMPGEQNSLEFVVENTSTVAHTYTASIYNVLFASETGEPQFGPLSREYVPWLHLDAYDFSLAAGASRVMTLTAAIPENAAVDTVIFAPVVRESSSGGGVTLSTGASSLIFLTVGNPVTHATIESFASSSLVSTRLPLTLRAVIANSGERIVQPYGIVRITDIFGNEIDSLDFNTEFRRVPTQLSREFIVQWGESLQDNGGFFQELWRELTAGIGLFTAELVAAPYPGAEPTLHATTRVVVFPWRIALALCGTGAFVSFVIARKRRRF